MRWNQAICLGISLLVTSGELSGQGMESLPARRGAVLAGIGNSFGWVGGQGERYFANDRLSLIVGVGHTPLGRYLPHEVHGLTVAGGLRGYTEGNKNRGFLELAVSQVAVLRNCAPEDCRRYYGPTIQAGFQRVTSSGFTFLLSWGIGHASGLPTGANRSGGVFGLGMGYTWRRRS